MTRPLLLMPLLAACAVEPDRMVLRSPGGSGGSGGDTGTCAVHGFGDRVDWPLPATGVSLRGLTDLTCSGPDDELHVVADLTGDRAPDLIRISDCERASGVGSAHWWVHENVGDGFAADPLPWPLPALSEPYPFQRWSDSFCDADVDHLFAVRDLTGDHRPDLVLLSDCDPASELGRSEWWVYENRGDGFASAPVVWAAPSDVGDEEWGSLEQVDCRGGTRDLYGLHDLDGDDAPELVRFAGCLESGDFDYNGTWTVWRNQGDGFASAPEVWTLPTDAPGRWDGIEGQNCKGEEDHLYVTRDLTGDGVLDLVVSSFCDTDPRWDERWWVYPGTGAGFEAPVDWPIPEHRAPGAWQYLLGRDCVTPTDSKGGLIDLDGDALPDLVRYGPCGGTTVPRTWTFHRNLGDGFAPGEQAWWLPDDTEPMTWATGRDPLCDTPEDRLLVIEDLNGDQLPDVVETYGCSVDSAVGASVWQVRPGGCR